MSVGKIHHPIPYISGPEEISNEDYHKSVRYKPFISSTQLKWYETSPKYYEYMKHNPEASQISLKASMEGSVYHDMLASLVNHGTKEGFNKNWFVFDPPINERTGKAYGIGTQKYDTAYMEAIVNNPGKEVTSQAEIDLCSKMIDELLYNNYHYSYQIRKFIEWGVAEQSGFCEYENSKFKYRTDLKTKKKIIDWKTTTTDDLHEDTIQKIILKFKYHISAAFYQFFEHQVTGEWKQFYWVFQQKKAPYDAVMVSAERWAYDVHNDANGQQILEARSGAMEFKSLLNQHLWCVENQKYPGASIFIEPDYRGNRVMEPDVPGYHKAKSLIYYND